MTERVLSLLNESIHHKSWLKSPFYQVHDQNDAIIFVPLYMLNDVGRILSIAIGLDLN